MEIVRLHYSELPDALSSGHLAADFVVVRVCAPDNEGRHSLGFADDYLSGAIDTARVVIAEINDQVTFTFVTRTTADADGMAAIPTSRAPAQMPTTAVDGQTRAVVIAHRQSGGLVRSAA